MENKKPKKIGLMILGFFYNFLWISKVLLKKKKKRVEQCWAESGPTSLGLHKIAEREMCPWAISKYFGD
jgi:hypothetical protein